MASVLDSYIKGLTFSGFGVFVEPVDFKDNSGNTVRFIRFASGGRTFTVPAASDDEFNRYKSFTGQSAKASGRIVRSSDTSFVNAKIDSFVLQGQPGWKEPSDEELLTGFVVSGAVVYKGKRMNTYNGVTYRRCQFSVISDTFELSNLSQSVYDSLPDNTGMMIAVQLGCEVRLDRKESSRFTAVDLRLENFKVLAPDPARSERSSARPAAA